MKTNYDKLFNVLIKWYNEKQINDIIKEEINLFLEIKNYFKLEVK